MNPQIEHIARIISICLFGHDCIPADTATPYATGSRIALCVMAAEAVAIPIERRAIDRCAREVHAFKDTIGRDGTDDWFTFVDLSMIIRDLPSEYVDA